MKKILNESILVIMVAMWGLSFSLTKPLLAKVGVFNFLAYRFVIGGFLLSALLIFTKKFKVSKGLLKSSILSGMLLFLAFYCHIEGLKYTSIAKNAFIVGSSVVFIPLILWLLHREKSSRIVLIQTLIAIVGLGIITLMNTSGGFNYGDGITLMGTFLYALYTITVERSVKKYKTDIFTAVQLSTVGILSLTATILLEDITFTFSTTEWLSIGFLSVVLTGFAYYLLNLIQKSLSASNVTLIFTLEPFFAMIFGWFFINETVGMNVIVGGLMIVVSVLLPYLKTISLKAGESFEL